MTHCKFCHKVLGQQLRENGLDYHPKCLHGKPAARKIAKIFRFAPARGDLLLRGRFE